MKRRIAQVLSSPPAAAGLAFLLAGVVLFPGGIGWSVPATAQVVGGPEMESGFAILAAHEESGRLAGAAVSTRVAGAGEGLLVQDGVGVAFASGRDGHEAAAATLSALRSGSAPQAAAREGAGRQGSGRVVVLDPRCSDGASGGGDLVGSTRMIRVRGAGYCFVAVAVQPYGNAGLDRLASALEAPASSLARRLSDALAAALPREAGLNAARSAALWIGSPGTGGSSRTGPVLDGAGLRLQAEDHPRPVARLDQQLRLVSARELAERAAGEIAAGRYADAAALADSALELDPASTPAWMARGRALLYDGDEEGAEEAFRRMLELDPTLLRFLGDPAGPRVNEAVIPYAPRLLLRLDIYRRAYFRTLDFGPEPAVPEGLAPPPASQDTSGG